MRIRKAAGLLLAVFLFILPATRVQAASFTEELFITLKVNGQPIHADTNPYIKHNRTFVPIRFVAQAFGMQVLWIQDEQKAILANTDTVIEMWIDDNRFVVNDEEKTLDVNIEGVDGRTMVPIRYIAEALEFTVHWDHNTNSVEMNKEGVEVSSASFSTRWYNDQDIIWLSRIVHVEGGYLSMEAKVAIANVVLNRVKDPRFPNTVQDVIFDTRYSVQFPPAHRQSFKDLTPCNTCVVAAKMALEGINNIDTCLFFNNRPFRNKEQDLYRIIDGEYFYY